MCKAQKPLCSSRLINTHCAHFLRTHSKVKKGKNPAAATVAKKTGSKKVKEEDEEAAHENEEEEETESGSEEEEQEREGAEEEEEVARHMKTVLLQVRRERVHSDAHTRTHTPSASADIEDLCAPADTPAPAHTSKRAGQPTLTAARASKRTRRPENSAESSMPALESHGAAEAMETEELFVCGGVVSVPKRAARHKR